MTAVDQQDVRRDGSTLRTLREDNWVVDDFDGVYFELPDAGDRLTIVDAMAALKTAQNQATA